MKFRGSSAGKWRSRAFVLDGMVQANRQVYPRFYCVLRFFNLNQLAMFCVLTLSAVTGETEWAEQGVDDGERGGVGTGGW